MVSLIFKFNKSFEKDFIDKEVCIAVIRQFCAMSTHEAKLLFKESFHKEVKITSHLKDPYRAYDTLPATVMTLKMAGADVQTSSIYDEYKNSLRELITMATLKDDHYVVRILTKALEKL